MLPIAKSKSLRTVRLTRTWTCRHRRQRRLGVFHSDWSERRSGPSNAWQTNVTARSERQALRKAEEASILYKWRAPHGRVAGVSLDNVVVRMCQEPQRRRGRPPPLDAVHRGDVCTLKDSPSRRLRLNGESHGRRPIGGERSLQRWPSAKFNERDDRARRICTDCPLFSSTTLVNPEVERAFIKLIARADRSSDVGVYVWGRCLVHDRESIEHGKVSVTDKDKRFSDLRLNVPMRPSKWQEARYY